MQKYTIFAVIIAVILDRIFGDPYCIPHPVVYIGKLISYLDSKLRISCKKDKIKEKISGFILVVIVIAITEIIVIGCLFICYKFNAALGIALESFWCFQLLAAKSLQRESNKVYLALKEKDVQKARMAVSMIVGRDTKALDENGITKAAVETVAENTSDGVTTPLIYMMLFGAAGGFFYKAVNTMDSMIGYKNDTYLNFGECAARLDDILNFIPSRLTAVLMIIAAKISGYDAKNAYYIWRRDRLKHASPNSAQTEAVCAGALNIQLAGDAWYFGIKHEKPFIGDRNREIEIEDICRAWRLMYGSEYILVLIYICLGALI